MKPKNVNCRKTILGKYEVTYDCPGCGESLKNDLDDAGKNDQCPHCECEFVVPGMDYKREIDRRRIERIEEKEAAKREAEEKAREQAAKAAEAKAKFEAELATKERQIRTAQQTQPAVNKTSIQYISEGLADLVRALFHSFLSGIFGSVTLACASLSQAGDRDGLLVLALIFGVITAGFVLSFFVAINESIDSFRKGANA